MESLGTDGISQCGQLSVGVRGVMPVLFFVVHAAAGTIGGTTINSVHTGDGCVRTVPAGGDGAPLRSSQNIRKDRPRLSRFSTALPTLFGTNYLEFLYLCKCGIPFVSCLPFLFFRFFPLSSFYHAR